MAAMRSRQQQLRQLKEQLQLRISTEKRAPKADWANMQFAWSTRLQQALQSVFGLQAFRCVYVLPPSDCLLGLALVGG
jgi:hypothetical protein